MNWTNKDDCHCFELQQLFTRLLQRFVIAASQSQLQANRFIWIISGLVVVVMAVYVDEQLFKHLNGATLAIGLFLSIISGLGTACSFL